jgi:hypothetical protein
MSSTPVEIGTLIAVILKAVCTHQPEKYCYPHIYWAVHCRKIYPTRDTLESKILIVAYPFMTKNGEQEQSNAVVSILNGMRKFDFPCSRIRIMVIAGRKMDGTLHHLHRRRIPTF